jgi:hypothetical protein
VRVLHIIPVSERPDLFVAWHNLTFVCTECNYRKGAYHSEAQPIVNPYIDEPSEHLWFCGPLVFDKDDKGLRTRELLELSSRGDLVEKRSEAIERINLLVREWSRLGEGETKEFIRKKITAAAAADAEYTATIRAMIVQRLGWEV